MSDAEKLRSKAYELIELMHDIGNMYPSRLNSDNFQSLYEVLKVVNKAYHEDLFAIINTRETEQGQIEYVSHSKDITVMFDSKKRKDYISIKKQEQMFSFQEKMYPLFEKFYVNNSKNHLDLLEKGVNIAQNTKTYLENLFLVAMGTNKDSEQAIFNILPHLNDESKVALLAFGFSQSIKQVAPIIIKSMNRPVDFIVEANEYYQLSWREILLKGIKKHYKKERNNRYYYDRGTIHDSQNAEQLDKRFQNMLNYQQEQIEDVVRAISQYYHLNSQMNEAKVVKKFKI